MEKRSLLIFEQSIKSEATKKNYKDQLEKFRKFSKVQDYDSLVSLPVEQLQTMVEDYVMYLKKNVSPNSVQTMMSGLKHFFIMNRVRLFWEVIQKMYPERVKSSGFKAWSSEQIKNMLEYTTSKRNKAIIHFLASTGSRVGVFNYDLSMKQLRDMEDGCKAVLIYAGEMDEYWTFLTPEASKALEDYFDEREKAKERFFADTPIFRSSYNLGIEKAKPVRRNAVISMIFRTINKAKIERKRINRNFDIQMDHGFRKRFNTILKLKNEVNSNIAEKIMGHSVSIPLDNAYLTPSIEKLFAEFKKAIPELTIDDSERLREQNKIKDQIIKQQESEKDAIINNLTDRMEKAEKILGKLDQVK